VIFSRATSLWEFNRLMLCGAGLGFFMGNATLSLVDTVLHQGPGIVAYHDDGSGHDYPQKVSESQFKRHEYMTNGLILVFGALFWVAVVTDAKKRSTKTDAQRAGPQPL
jgi:hypothetical protein